MGKGDMLMKTIELKDPIRIQAAVIEDEEVDEIVGFLRKQSLPQYDEGLMEALAKKDTGAVGGAGGGSDGVYNQAVELIVGNGTASTAFLQRKLHIGYGRAASLIDQMEESGIVGPAGSARNGGREVLVSSGEIDINDGE
jgi:S-DNA-T family DNA segregation ATPase FtsK/SpoIIIE